MAAKVSAKRLANPALRSKIPTAQLPLKYRKMREANARKAAANDPNALTAPLTPASLDAQVAAQTNLYAAPAQLELDTARATHDRMSATIPAWFKDFRDAEALATEKTKQAYGAALGVQQNTMTSTAALDASQQQAMQGSMQADAAARGATVDPQIAATAQQAASSRLATQAAQQGLTVGLGAAQTSYSAGRERAGAAQQITAQLDEARRGRDIDVAGGKLALQKGQFATKTRQELIDAEHTKQLENKAFGLDVEKAKIDATQTDQKLQLDAEKLKTQQELNDARLTNDQARIAIAQRNADIADRRANTYATSVANGVAKKKKASAKATASTGAARKDISFALSHIPKLLAHHPPKQQKDSKTGKVTMVTDKNGKPIPGDRPLSQGEVRDLLENGKIGGRKIPHDAINAALKLLDKQHGGYLDAAQIAGLRAAYPGIHIGSLGYTTKNGRARKRAKLKTYSTLADLVTGGGAPAHSKTRP